MDQAEEKKISKKGSVFRGTVVVFTVMLASKLAAFISEAILANYLGTSSIGDAYYMVSGIQQVLYPMLSVGIWKIFLPRYKALLTTKGYVTADKLASAASLMFLAMSAIFTILIAIFAEGIVSLVAPGFDFETRSLCAELVRITSPMYVFIIWSSIYATMLQCHDKFLGSQIREIATHIPVILLAIFFYGQYGVYALAAGLVLGGIARLVIELPFMNWGYKPTFKIKDQKGELVNIIKALPAALTASGADEVTILVNKIMASFQGVGAVSALNYASKLQNVFNGLFSKALITAAYPKMAEQAATKDYNALNGLMLKSVAAIATFIIPITVGTIIFSSDIVAVIFQRGSFGIDATELTSRVYCFYAIGLLFSALFTLFNNAFYVLEKSRFAMRTSLLSMALNVIASITLTQFMGAAGLAAAASLSYFVTTVVQGVMLKKLTGINFRNLTRDVLKTCISTVVAVFVAWFVSTFIASLVLRVLAVVCIASVIYFVMLVVLKSESIGYVLNILKKRKKA